jgi:hypothetical protein
MASNKTQITDMSVEDFLQSITTESIRKDCYELCAMMQDITKEKPVMWGNSMVGFGQYSYKYKTGREGTWFIVGFSPKKKNISVYCMSGFEQHDQILAQLGKFTVGSSCLYINSLSDIHNHVLRELISHSVQIVQQLYPSA